MDWQSIVVIAIVIFAMVWLLMRLKGGARNPPALRVAMELIANINDDMKIITQRQADPGLSKKFKTGNWKSYQHHIDFLEKDVQEAIKASFNQMETYNNKLLGITPETTPGTVPEELSLEALKEVLVKARVGLAHWIRENINRESTRGMFSWK